MDERLKEVEKFLDDDYKEARVILSKLYKLRPEEGIEWLRDWTQRADSLYNGAPELKPRDLQKLADKFRQYEKDGTRKPLKKNDYKAIYDVPTFKAFPEPPLNIKRFNSKILQNSDLDKEGAKVSGSKDKQEFADKFNRDIEEQTQGSNPRAANQPMGNDGLLNESRIVSLDGRMTDFELKEILKDLSNKTDQGNLIIKDGPYSLVLENSKQDWQNKIDELELLNELYPVWENIASIIKHESQQGIKKQATSELLDKREDGIIPPQKDINKWIKGISESISTHKGSDIQDPRTINLYLHFLVDKPTAGVDEIRGGLLTDESLPACDFETLENLHFNSLRGWEKRFFKTLENRFYKEYAQRFKRFS